VKLGFIRPRLGWRPRLLVALILCSALTLAVAAAALLSPLEQRLRASAESSLKGAVSGARAELSELAVNPETGLPEFRELHAILDLLRRQQGAQPFLLNARLQPLFATGPGDFDIPPIYPLALRVLETHRGFSQLRGTLYILAKPVRIGDQRFVLVVTKHLAYVTSAVSTVQSAFLEAAAVGLGFAILVGFGLSGWLVLRLRQLRDAARKLEQSGPETSLELKPSRDEIGEVAATLRSMQRRLADQERALRSFIATASHELRTPLASLEGLLELIAEDLDPHQPDLGDARERTARARDQARRLAKLATDLLDISRLDSGVELRREEVELGELARALAAELELQARAKGVSIKVSGGERPLWVVGDPSALARIVRILLDNALRVSPEGGVVTVDLAERGKTAELVVSDEGPGVDPAERELIFERFRRGTSAARTPGFGLGLAIGRELANRLGAELVLLDSDRPGARFALRLDALAQRQGAVEAPV